nr:stress response protein NST1-like [Aedes albopictus]
MNNGERLARHTANGVKNACPQRPTRNQKAKGGEVVARTYASAVIHGGVALAQQEAVNEEKEVVKEDSEAKAEADEGEEQGTLQGTEPIVYQSEYEKTLAENWAKHEAEKRKRQEEYRKQEKSMQRRYQENLRAKEEEQKERWEKCEAERRSRQEKFNRESFQQQQVLPVESLLQSPPKKNARKQ